MSPAYHELHTTAFDLRADAIQGLAGKGAILAFEPGWIRPLLDLFQQRKPNLRSLPITSLNTAAVALVPGITAEKMGVGYRGGDWLYRSTADGAGKDTSAVELLLPAWMRVEAGTEHEEEALRLWERLGADGLSWKDVDTKQFAWTAAKADTPEATASIADAGAGLWRLLPQILADHILNSDQDRPDGFPRGFRRVPRSSGAGLVSWPPLCLDRTKRDPGWFSFHIELTVQSNALRAEPQLIVQVGLRRWLNKAAFRAGGASVNAHLLSTLPWLKGQAADSGFRIAPMRRRKFDGTWQLAWDKGLRDIFDRIAFNQELPDLEQLTMAPATFFDGNGPSGTAIALPHATAHDGKHPVGPGVSARDRAMIVDWITEALADLVTPAELPTKVPLTIAKRPPLGSEVVRRRIAQELHEPFLRLEIHHDSNEDPQLRQAVRDAVTADLGLDTVSAGDRTTWKTDEFTVVIDEEPIGERGGPIEPVAVPRQQRARALREAVEKRRQLIRDQLPRQRERTLAIVELPGRAAFSSAGSDPKGAIRIGYADTGRLNQFMTPHTPDSNSLEHRAEKAWRDVRRQLVGCMAAPDVRLKGRAARSLELPAPMDTVGLYMLRRNATANNWTGREQTPVAVWISSDSAKVYARIPGVNDWFPYAELHTRLASGIAFRENATDKRAALKFIGTVLDTTRSEDRPVLLQAWTQNLRGVWPELALKRLTVDTPRLDDRPLGRAFDNFRLVTIRTNDYGETPEVYGIDANSDEPVFGIAGGLWRLSTTARTFISTAGRPDSAKSHASPMSSRIAPRIKTSVDTETGATTRAEIWEVHKPAFNSDGLQLTTAWLQPGDDPLVWAAVTHAQRNLSDTYDETLKLPIALQLAKQATEYAFPETASHEDDEAATD